MDEHAHEVYTHRYITSLYFSELQTPMVRLIRSIPLKQFVQFIKTFYLKKLDQNMGSKSSEIPHQDTMIEENDLTSWSKLSSSSCSTDKKGKDFLSAFMKYMHVIIEVITQKIKAGPFFSFKRQFNHFSEPTKAQAYFRWFLRRYSMLRVAITIRFNQHKLLSKFKSKLDQIPLKFKFRIKKLSNKDLDVINNLPKVKESTEWIKIEEGLLEMTLNEMYYYGEAFIFEKRFMKSISKKVYKEVDGMDKEFIGMEVKDTRIFQGEELFGSLPRQEDCLIDLRSKMIGSSHPDVLSLAKFSFEI